MPEEQGHISREKCRFGRDVIAVLNIWKRGQGYSALVLEDNVGNEDVTGDKVLII